ncbi:MAG: response regulator [Acidobacteriota bacterium]
MKKILVVDDEPSVREVLTSFLGDYGYDVKEAEDGERALEVARELRPQIVLLDVAMPKMSGIEVLRRLRQEAPESTVIMISGHADEQTALDALDMGAYDFIRKPFDLDYLENVVLVKMATCK